MWKERIVSLAAAGAEDLGRKLAAPAAAISHQGGAQELTPVLIYTCGTWSHAHRDLPGIARTCFGSFCSSLRDVLLGVVVGMLARCCPSSEKKDSLTFATPKRTGSKQVVIR